MNSEFLSEENLYERDVRLYGVTVARWLRAQKNLGLSAPMPDKGEGCGAERVSPPEPNNDGGIRKPSADKPFNLKSLESYL